MDFVYSTKASYLLGFIVILLYTVVSYWKKSPAQLPDAILLLLATTSIPPCIRVIKVFYGYNGKTIQQIGETEQSYIIIGALAVIWLSGSEIIKKFSDKLKN